MINFICKKFSYKASKSKNSSLNIINNEIFYKANNKFKPILGNIVGIIIGSSTTTFSKMQPSEYNPWKCLSIICRNRTYDFEFEKYNDVSLFLFAIRLLKNHEGYRLHNISRSKLKLLKEMCEEFWMPEDDDWLECFTSYKDWYNYFILKNDDYILATFSNKQRKVCPDHLIGEECSICLEKFLDVGHYIELPCKHFFHKECLKNWVAKKKQCPLCRRNL